MTGRAHPSTVLAVLDAVDDVLLRIQVSADPVVVLASLAEACVPGFSDVCEVAHHPAPSGAGRRERHRVPPRDHRHVVRTGFARSPYDPGPDYAGVVVHGFVDRPVDPLVAAGARIVVDRAVAVIAQVRLVHEGHLAERESAQLHVALDHSREIGPAIGILMANHKITYDAAFALLREASQNSNRKLHSLALEVVQTGMLDPGVRRGAGGP